MLRRHLHPSLATIPLLAFLVTASLGVAQGRAEETPADEEKAPAASTLADLVKSLPAPSPGHGFVFEGDVLFQGQTMGTARYEARFEPGQAGKAATWRFLEEVRSHGGDGPQRHVKEATMSAAFEPVQGSVEVFKEETSVKRIAWRRGDGAFVLTTRHGEGPESSQEIAQAGPTLPALSSVFLLARLLPTAAGEVRASFFDAQERAVRDVVLRFEVGTWADRPARTVRLEGAREGQVYTLALRRLDGTPQAIRVEEPGGGRTMEIVPASTPVRHDEDDDDDEDEDDDEDDMGDWDD